MDLNCYSIDKTDYSADCNHSSCQWQWSNAGTVKAELAVNTVIKAITMGSTKSVNERVRLLSNWFN